MISAYLFLRSTLICCMYSTDTPWKPRAVHKNHSKVWFFVYACHTNSICYCYDMATDREKLDDIFETPNKFSDVPVEQTLGALAWLVVRQRAEMIMFLNSLTLEPDTTAEITRGFAHMQRDFFDVVMVGVGVDTYSHPRMQHPMEAAINKQVKLLMAQGDMMSDLLD